MQSFEQIINLWPSAAEFGRDVDISAILARQWRNRNSIPAKAWLSVQSAASERGFRGVTVEAMAKIAQQRRQTVEKPCVLA